LGLELPPLRGADRKPGVITRAKSGSALSRVGDRKSIRQIEINKAAISPDIF